MPTSTAEKLRSKSTRRCARNHPDYRRGSRHEFVVIVCRKCGVSTKASKLRTYTDHWRNRETASAQLSSTSQRKTPKIIGVGYFTPYLWSRRTFFKLCKWLVLICKGWKCLELRKVGRLRNIWPNYPFPLMCCAWLHRGIPPVSRLYILTRAFYGNEGGTAFYLFASQTYINISRFFLYPRDSDTFGACEKTGVPHGWPQFLIEKTCKMKS